MAFAVVAEIARALGIEVRVERDLIDPEAAEQLRQHDRRVAPRVVDHDFEPGLLDRVRGERFEKRARVAFEHARGEVEQADVVHSGAPEILAEEEIFDLAFGALIGRDPLRVEELHDQRVGIVGRDADVNAAVAADAYGVAGER